MQQNQVLTGDLDVLVVFNTTGTGQDRIFYSSELENFLKMAVRGYTISSVFVDTNTIVPDKIIGSLCIKQHKCNENSMKNPFTFVGTFVSNAKRHGWKKVGVFIDPTIASGEILEKQLAGLGPLIKIHPQKAPPKIKRSHRKT